MIFVDGEWIDALGFIASVDIDIAGCGRLTSYRSIDTGSSTGVALSALLDWSELIEASRPFDERETVQCGMTAP